MSLKNSILRIFSANFLSMISGIIIGFVVPAILSVESYSFVKTYAFYISYIGFLHFGFVDGMYIKYGGKSSNEIDKAELKGEHKVFLLMQAIVTAIFLIFAFVNNDVIMFLIALSIIPVNTYSFHQLYYQATGQFKDYVKVSYVYTLMYLLLNIFLALIFRSENKIFYCLTTLVANGMAFLFLEYRFYKSTRGIKAKYDLKALKNIKVGFFILLGNLSVMMFYAIDRWFIKLFFDVDSFAYYSFAISMLNIINLLVSAVSVTFYNYLSKGEKEEEVKKLKNAFLILGGFASLGYFAFAAIVSIMIKKYIPALNIIAISFAAYPYMIVINALYVNLYKARKNEKRYVKVVFFMVLISAIYNTVAMFISKTPEAIAVATTLAFITWYIYSIKDFGYLTITKKEFIYLLVLIVSFLTLSNNFNWLVGGLAYLSILIVLNFITFNKEIKELLKIFKGKVKIIKQKAF